MPWYRVVISLLLLSPLADAAERQVLHGHVPADAKRLVPLRRLDSADRLDLSIALPLKNTDQLNKFLLEVYDPSSPNYHRYLTPEQFAKQFGASEKDYNALIAFAKAHNLTILGTHPNRTLLDVNGLVADIEKAFHLNMRVYQHPSEPRTFRAPDTEPSVDLTVPVLSISGLDDFNLPRPMNGKKAAFRKFLERSAPKKKRGALGMVRPADPEKVGRAFPGAPVPAPIPYATGSGPRATFIGNDFRTAYAPGVTLDGAGQSVGLFELDGYFPNDISEYEKLAGLPNVPITNVLVNGFSGRAGINNIEVALDIDMVISMAPELSKVIVYEGTPGNANAILNRMATDNLAKQLSSSWGFGLQLDPARDQIFQQFAAQGQSMFQASGDAGAQIGPIFPPSDNPWLTVVGGTSLNMTTPGGAWQSETTWSGSSGGVSTTYTIPPWQQGMDMATILGSATMRNIPDVAAHSDVNIWVIVNNGEEGIVGGTSAAAPVWAGFTALANQQAAFVGRPSVGFINPAIYAIGKGPTYGANFHDITTGNNTNDSSGNEFFAFPGFDLCTGWGTPNGSNLIASLVSPPDTLRISPSANFLATGPPGGLLIPAELSYTLTNFGSAPLSWSLVNTSLWLNASALGGTLVAGGPGTNVVLSLNAAASNVVAGSYSTLLLFSNLNDQTVQSRVFTLAIVTPPAITAQPVDQSVFEGSAALLKVGTATNALLNFQWRRDGGTGPTNLADVGNVSGAGSGTLKIIDVSPSDVGTYSVIVSNAAGVAISSNASLTILPRRPFIAAQPRGQTLLAGQTATFAVAVLGSSPLYYRWQRSGTNLTDAANISGASASVLTIGNISPVDAATYAVVVTNAFGSNTSAGAALTVISSNAPDVTLDLLHSFSGGNDGANPNGLILATNGIFYGTTQHGGVSNLGTIFQLNSAGAPSTLYSFSGTSDGANPFASLIQGADGNFYGTAFQGGAFDNGTIYKLTPNGAFTNLLSLNITNGDLPYAGLTMATDGNFYGATYQGGAFGIGTIFKITPAGLLTTLYSFSGDVFDGGFPHASLTLGTDGSFYGTTHKGGAFNYGTVFRITTNGFLYNVFSFDNTNGAFSYAALARAVDGNLYGTTAFGGSSSNGTIFKITTSNQFTNIYSFPGGIGGAQPMAGLLVASDGNLYGTTANGGAFGLGMLFRIVPNGTITNLAHFDGVHGANPQAPLADGQDSHLYGATQYGGANGKGAIFRINFSSAPQIIIPPTNQTAFAGANVSMSVVVTGSRPLLYQWKMNGTNLLDGGNISGSTTLTLIFNSLTTNNTGTYSLFVSNAFGWAQSSDATLSVTSTPPIIVTQPASRSISPGVTVTFTVNAIGNLPLAYQWRSNGFNLVDGGNVSGSSSNVLTILTATERNNATYSILVSNPVGSTLSQGAVLTVIPASVPGTRLATLYSFTGNIDGATPNGLTAATNGILYGTTQLGGAYYSGSVFSVNTNGVVTAPLLSFSGVDGYSPRAALIQGADGNFYGTTPFGGVNFLGNVFRMSSSGALTNIYSFSGNFDGSNPYAPLLQATNGDFYGFATSGGTNGYGTTCRINPNGVFTLLYSFNNGTDDSAPSVGLIQGLDGRFYGVTSGGGNFRKGSVFRLATTGVPTTIYSFTGMSDGSLPNALVYGTDGYLYGTTTHTLGSVQSYGNIFRMTTDGQFVMQHALNFPEGFYPFAGLLQANDGNFYGTTHDGGTSGNGTIFRFAPNGSFMTLASFDGFNDGAHPAASLVQGPDGALYGTTTTGGWGGRGTIFRLAYTSAPQIITQPTNQTVSFGATATFAVTVTGASPLSYQWRKSGINISGATQRILTITNVSVTNAGAIYSVFVRNTLGTASSIGALLTVLNPASFLSVAKTNTSIMLSWNTVQGQRYQVQRKYDLNFGSWANLGAPITAPGATLTFYDPIQNTSQKFYRVLRVP